MALSLLAGSQASAGLQPFPVREGRGRGLRTASQSVHEAYQRPVLARPFIRSRLSPKEGTSEPSIWNSISTLPPGRCPTIHTFIPDCWRSPIFFHAPWPSKDHRPVLEDSQKNKHEKNGIDCFFISLVFQFWENNNFFP